MSEAAGAAPRAGFYGDDFTGSVDALLQFARAGWSGRLFVGLPDDDALREAAATVDVVGIAGIARSLPREALDAEVRPALTALAALHPPLVQYKACSTADSSPDVGSIGRVIEIARDVVGEGPVPLLFAQPDFGRYTVFGHHFAAEDGVVHRLDRQPTMSTHPSTPMTESDLARHLSRQTTLPIDGIPFTRYTSSAAVMAALVDSPAAATVLDAADAAHLALVGRAIAALETPVFAVGSGGLSLAVATARPGRESPPPAATPARGPVLAVSGSWSTQTRRQMDAAADAGWLVETLPLDAADRDAAIARTITALGAGRSVAFRSDHLRLDDADPLHALARAGAHIVAAVLDAGAASRVIVCGGDTSSRITTLLGVRSLSIAANPVGNIVLLRAHADDPAVDGVELLLKGGQVGGVDLFDEVRRLGESEAGSR